MNFAKILRTLFLQNISGQLFLEMQYLIILTYLFGFVLKKSDIQKQLPRGVLRKRCFENTRQIYSRTNMPKCNFNKVTLGVVLKICCIFSQNVFLRAYRLCHGFHRMTCLLILYNSPFPRQCLFEAFSFEPCFSRSGIWISATNNRRHTRKCWTLDAWSKPLDSGHLDAWTLDVWSLDLWPRKFYPFLVTSFLLSFTDII